MSAFKMFGLDDNELNRRQQTIGIFQSIFTIGAIFIGGLWAWQNFTKKREGLPHANIEHHLVHKKITKNNRLLHLAVKISNTGERVLKLICGTVYIQQINPLDESILEKINKGEDPVSEVGVVDWPSIADRTLEWKEGEALIEPDENETIYFEFIIPSSVKTIMAYSYFPAKRTGPGQCGAGSNAGDKTEIGRTLTTLHDLGIKENGDDGNVEIDVKRIEVK